MTNSPNAASSSLLLKLGATVGPFVGNFCALAVLSMMGWPPTTIGHLAALILPVVFGAVCLYFAQRPKGFQWLEVIPYSAFFLILLFFIQIIFAILLGAPK